MVLGASLIGDKDLVEFLLENGADINAMNMVFLLFDLFSGLNIHFF